VEGSSKLSPVDDRLGAPSVLYISYDGMLEPLGQSQVLGYLLRLAQDHRIVLISFEKEQDWDNETQRQRTDRVIADAGITWHPLRYHKRPTLLATAWDVACGVVLGWKLIRQHGVEIVHARSYVAGVMAMVLKSWTGIRFLFDMRGFWVDERVDGGLWSRAGLLFHVGKWFERRLLLSADHIISLTQVAVVEMQSFDYLRQHSPVFTVIPTCADLRRFTPPLQRASEQPFVLGYVGSAGTWYLFDEVVSCFVHLLKIRPDARFLIVNRGEHAYIRNVLSSHGVDLKHVELVSATHQEVPCLMGRMDAGVFLIKPAYSKTASSPTKLGELLGCGVPCLCNAGVGDMAQVVEGEKVGVTLQSLEKNAIEKAVSEIVQMAQDPATRARCVDAARRHFSLDEGVARYARVYKQLSAKA
jgi:glycosyltransferase involved in cell wall biosynthesis